MRKQFKNKGYRLKRAAFNKYALFFLFYVLFSFQFFAQDSIPQATDLSEEKELKFQTFFFKALSEKSIKNYQKAIENLEACNQILENDVAVFFEFSKNYLLLNNTRLAEEYIKRALAKESENIWMLQHLVEIHKKNKAYREAIQVQQKIIDINPSKKSDLVYLLIKDEQFAKAKSLLDEIENTSGLTGNLYRLQLSLNSLQKPKKQPKKASKSLENLALDFKNNKSFVTLKLLFKLLEKQKNYKELEQYATKGISYFPAQPLVYLTKGQALNQQQKYQEALQILQSGIDFVIDAKMEKNFYKQMAFASKGLGNKKDEKKFKELAKKLKS